VGRYPHSTGRADINLSANFRKLPSFLRVHFPRRQCKYQFKELNPSRPITVRNG
jgi:hypothetical protein